MSEVTNEPQNDLDIFEVRRQKLVALRERGEAFVNDFHRDTLAQELHTRFDNHDQEALGKVVQNFAVAGRMMTCRLMGKASFVTLRDMSGDIQLYVRQEEIENYEDFKHWDLGDILGAVGTVFKTKTGELSLKVTKLRLLVKSLRPLPEKWHGIADPETRYRQRYLDLITSPETRHTFVVRAKVVETIRRLLVGRQFLEVETPMMHPLAGGAAARPFVTHHNTLDMELFLRIAPELYLKRLLVGGFEKVFEINRNFRNEGISTRHNPEFTMIEFYEAYIDYLDAMRNTEDLVRAVVCAIIPTGQVPYQGQVFDFAKPFDRMTVTESIVKYNPNVSMSDLSTLAGARAVAKQFKNVHIKDSDGLGMVQIKIFEETVEHQLMQPTFITAYPTEVSPLARKNAENPDVTDRFEFFIGGREIANGFSELNDPEDQERRFLDQVEAKASGDDEAMPHDADYITALEYGMPPAAGVGIGIDRLVMLLTDSASIRDVILFPQLRKKE